MNKQSIEGLYKKYLEGKSTLEEENTLFNATNQESSLDSWSKYVKKSRTPAPENFNSLIWSGIENRKKRKHRYLRALSTVAASITILIAIGLYKPNKNELSLEKKKALLNEALAMFPNQEPNTQNLSIIYEDEIIIIYKASK